MAPGSLLDGSWWLLGDSWHEFESGDSDGGDRRDSDDCDVVDRHDSDDQGELFALINRVALQCPSAPLVSIYIYMYI